MTGIELKTIEKGYLHIYTGNGKTTFAYEPVESAGVGAKRERGYSAVDSSKVRACKSPWTAFLRVCGKRHRQTEQNHRL